MAQFMPSLASVRSQAPCYAGRYWGIGRPVARLLVCLACLASCWPAISRAAVPEGFTDVPVARFDGATALAFLPDGRALVAGRTGELRILDGQALSRPILDLRERLCWDAERGMVGVAVDPRFASNRFIYLYYTYARYGTGPEGRCERRTSRTPVNRLARFEMGPGDAVDPASERVLLDNIPSFSGNHNAGDLGFGKDGYLYVSVGDGGCDYARDSGCFDQNDAARDRNVLLGKILRITRNGGVPRDNPFRGRNAGRCAQRGRIARGKTCAEAYALGLRNPFRFAFDPNARGTRFFINDTGEQAWEEIDLGRPGADYGWNLREGPCPTNVKTHCDRTPTGLTNPVYAYRHTKACGVITGGAFIPRGVWPDPYEAGYLFADYRCGKISLLRPGARRAVPFANGEHPVIDMVFAPDGALYYTTWDFDRNAWVVRTITPSSVAGDSRCGRFGAAIVLLTLAAAPLLRRRLRFG
jgi:glucose/arabinose dehydrogenase